MRTIGLIGGMCWDSTAEYYRMANQQIASHLGGFHSARILLDSLDFAEIERFQVEGDWNSAGAVLARSARTLERAGAAVIVLGTSFTMEQPFHRERLASHGLTVVVPDADDRAAVHRIIYDELVHGVIREESRAVYRRVIARLVDAGAEGVILGCTEIELLITAADSAVPLFPTAQIHVAAAVDFALSE
ncbi:amino acid racemase [Microbacterium sp. SSW1-49]|uniref:Amino acid racemase n=1 Tax=Microbacterium croceum TaxID=2851645 RepID=A0ABT0FIK2_9MICO|nr:amino acid racemase [Microbacterium croceum]MCK2037896.1 amino acid racemase [Microbacterium croceum]